MLSIQLARTVEDELRWREAELTYAKLQLQRNLHDPRAFSFAYRCFVAMTYAHYEGFTKRVLAQALADLQALTDAAGASIFKADLSRTIIRSLLVPKIRKALLNLSDEDLLDRVCLGIAAFNTVSLPEPDDVFGISTMDYDRFGKTVSYVGLAASSFSDYKVEINHLTNLRHTCAHGEALTFNRTKTTRDLAEGMFKLQRRVIELMHKLAVDLVDHFECGRFAAVV